MLRVKTHRAYSAQGLRVDRLADDEKLAAAAQGERAWLGFSLQGLGLRFVFVHLFLIFTVSCSGLGEGEGGSGLAKGGGACSKASRSHIGGGVPRELKEHSSRAIYHQV